MNLSPKVSVIIPHFNDLEGLNHCLRALAHQTFPKTEFEIIVADNSSPQGEVAIAKVIRDRARLITVKDRGAGLARNGAVARAMGEILAFVDSDCRADPAWIFEGVKALSLHDIVGGRVEVLVEDEEHVAGPEAFERVFAFDIERYISKKGFAGSGNLFCPRLVFEKVGGFRVGLSEDVEWCRRARERGYRIGYAPMAVVGHPARRTWPELKAKWRRINRETFALESTQISRKILWWSKVIALPASAIVHSPRALFSERHSKYSQGFSALAVLWRLRLWRFADAIRLATSNPDS